MSRTARQQSIPLGPSGVLASELHSIFVITGSSDAARRFDEANDGARAEKVHRTRAITNREESSRHDIIGWCACMCVCGARIYIALARNKWTRQPTYARSRDQK